MKRAARVMVSSWALLLTAAVPILSGCVVVGVAGCSEPASFSSAERKTTAHIAAAGLDVQTINGAITARKSDSEDVTISTRVRAVTQERADATHVTATRATDGSLVLRVQWPEGQRRPNEGCDIEVEIPETAWLRLNSSNGAIKAVGLAGTADLHSSNGAILVSNHGGSVTAKTSNGSITAEGVAGSVSAESSNGAIKMMAVEGFASADTSNGKITVELADGSPGPVKLTSSNGAVVLAVGPGFAGTLKAETSNGRISDDLPDSVKYHGGKRSRTYTFAKSGPESIVSTSNGTVTIKPVAGH